MKRGTIIALAILVVLIAAFFATRDQAPTTVATPYKLKKIDVSRIELTRPKDGGAELVVLQKGESGWKLTKPVESELSPTAQKEITAAFETQLTTDDIKLSKDKLAEYELDEAQAVKVALFEAKSEQPAAEFSVGKEIVVKQTRARRSYIMSDKGKPYRARISYNALRLPMKDLRSRVVFSNPRDKISELTLSPATGDSITLLKNADGTWFIKDLGLRPEMSVVNSILSSMSSLNAVDFTDKKLSEIGLKPPTTTVKAKVGDAYVGLAVGKAGEEYFARPTDSEEAYKISPTMATNMLAGLDELRDRLPKKVEYKAFSRVEFANGVAAQKNGESWELLKPSKSAVNEGKLNALLTTLGGLRVSRYTKESTDITGLGRPSKTVTGVADGKTHKLLIGNELEGGKEVYAKWSDKDDAFVVSKFMIDRLSPKAEDLMEQAK